MKKIISILLILVMAFTFAGCGAKGDQSPYAQVDDWSKYVTVADYSDFEVEYPEVEATDDEIDEEIANRLANATGATEDVFEGEVAMGDQITISFKGTLEDGTTNSGLNSDSFQLTLGQTSMIDGFTEGIVGHSIGDSFTEELTFPDPYEMNAALSGVGVTFDITILSKQVPTEAEFNEDFIKSDSENQCTTEEEYRAFIKEYLETTGYENEVYNAKTQLYYDIMHECETIDYYEPAVTYEHNYIVDKYHTLAEQSGQEFAEYLQAQFQMTEEQFNESIDEYVKSMVSEKQTIYALCDKEGIKLTDKEYEAALDDVLAQSGVDSENTFENQYGMTLDEYAEKYSLRLNKMLDKFLDQVFDRLATK